MPQCLPLRNQVQRVETLHKPFKRHPPPSIQSDSHESQQEMKSQNNNLLLDLTRTHQQLYFRNKPAFYRKLQRAFSKKGYNLSTEKNRKKLANMLTTYKRVKDRHRATGEGKNAWEYYTQMDECDGSVALPLIIITTPSLIRRPSPGSRLEWVDERRGVGPTWAGGV